MKGCYNFNFATVSKDSFVILVMWSCSAFCPRCQISHCLSSIAMMIVKMLNWKMFGLNRMCRSGRNIPVVAFGTEGNHKISQSLQPVLWPRCEPKAFLTKSHNYTFKLTCSMQLAVSVRFSLSTCSNRAIFLKMSFLIPMT